MKNILIFAFMIMFSGNMMAQNRMKMYYRALAPIVLLDGTTPPYPPVRDV